MKYETAFPRRSLYKLSGATSAAHFLFATLSSSHAAPCGPGFGDVNGDGLSTIVDAQCAILAVLWVQDGGNSSLPSCLGGELLKADLNCSNKVDVSDVSLAIFGVLQGAPPAIVDADGDGCIDTCNVCFPSAASCGADGCCPALSCGPAQDPDCSADFDYLGIWPADWGTFEQAVFLHVNTQRASGAICGSTAMPAVGPLLPQGALQASARHHSLDMATWPCAQHDDCDGARNAGERIADFGFFGSLIAENITAGWPMTPVDAVNWLMGSPGHCATIMNGNLTLMGVGYAFRANSPYRNYVTVAFGAP